MAPNIRFRLISIFQETKIQRNKKHHKQQLVSWLLHTHRQPNPNPNPNPKTKPQTPMPMPKENTLFLITLKSSSYADAANVRSLIRSLSQSNDWGLRYVTTRSWFLARAQPT